MKTRCLLTRYIRQSGSAGSTGYGCRSKIDGEDYVLGVSILRRETHTHTHTQSSSLGKGTNYESEPRR